MDSAHTWQLTIDTRDPARLVEFWAPVLGYVPQPPPAGHRTWNDYYRSVGVPEHELDADGDGTDRILDPTGRGPKIWFQWVPEEKSVKNRLHLDVYVAERGSLPHPEHRRGVQERVAELEARGATTLSVTDDPEHGFYFTVMLDPGGNEFCVG